MATSERFEVLIVGAGPAGIAAACAASRTAKVGVVDDNPAPGGQIWRGGKPPAGDGMAATILRQFQALDIARLCGTQIVAAPVLGTLLAEQAGDRPDFCVGKNGTVPFAAGSARPVQLGYDKLILATGARERFLPFPGWTLPNVVGAGGLQALLKAGLPIEGRRIVVAGSGPLLLSVAAYAKQGGANVSVVAEQAPWRRVAGFGVKLLLLAPGKLWQGAGYRWLLRGTRYLTGCWPTAAHGSAKVEAVTLQCGGRTWTEPCDILACGFGLVPNIELPALLGCEVRDGAVAVDELQQSSVPSVYCAGEITGIGGADLAVSEGVIAGYAAAGRGPPPGHGVSRYLGRHFAKTLSRAFRLRPELRNLPDADTFVCRCEDVTHQRLQGFASWRAAKLHTRCGMGSCQGRVCGAAAEFLFGWKNDSPRPPVFPASVGALAGATASGKDDNDNKDQKDYGGQPT